MQFETVDKRLQAASLNLQGVVKEADEIPIGLFGTEIAQLCIA